MKFKKVTALALCVAMSATALAGCGSKAATTDSQTAAPAESAAADTADDAAEAPVETKDVTLKVWAPQEDQNPTDTYDKGMLAAMCDAFNEAHPEWNITYEYGVCGEDVAKDEVTKDVDAAADVYMFANDQLPILVEAGAVAELGGKNLEEIKATNSESMVNSVTYDGGVYGVPFAYNGWFMYYDSSKFTEDEVKDLDVMMAKDLGDDVINVCFHLDNSWNMPAFYYGVGGTMFGPDGTDGSSPCDFDDEKGLAVTNYLIDLNANPKFTNQSNEEAGKAVSLFAEGKLGAYFTGSWDRAAIEEALGDNFVNFNAVMTMLGNYDIISEWNYYKDGKSWLCKALYKKKTILWLSVWNDCFKLSFFFTEKTKIGIENLEIAQAIKERFNQQKAAGKLIPLIIDVRDCTLLSEIEQIVEYKMRCK